MDCNLKKGGSFRAVSVRLQIIGYYNDCFLFSLCELRLYPPLDVQRNCSEWIRLATTNFRIVGTKNPRNPRDRAPYYSCV